MQRLSDWYDHPEYYEAIFGTDTERELDFLLEVGRRYGTGGKLLLEPACGAGRFVAEAARRGYQMVGYDISEKMLAHARRRLTPAQRRRVRLYPSRMETFYQPELEGKVDLAFNLVSTFRYLDSEKAALAHLEGTRRLLKPEGLYVLGFHLTDYERSKAEHERWVERLGKDTVVCNTHEGLPERRLRRSAMRNRLRITGPGKDLFIETHWYFRTYDLTQTRSLFRKAGLQVLAVYDFDYQVDTPRKRGEIRLDSIFVLRRASAGADD
ncbi:bifunctional 2-polyprenyl-6-hydroxyphenol methylase/3-demethylubiquinol 3-O-methyltransferase UbiG [Vitiosangium sp. GDMCC 1.1324]|uniref:class I SAM-dependent methyltransferase n=1 Tax=Vitiosangium sp. (strain GDMCC 1.1324) TaxID=2138576 RepID=UPI000D3495DB|nr:class I SAM-dependent methyltransferase [Vitiosangium sp. GDMCC 1.1324]PTL78457.1 class I SAM-dependent methyltransferase [Vitiosangium sp. GDMCC 1.1324]